MENKNDFVIGKFLIWCIENELWKENVKIENKKNDKFKHCDVFTVHYLEFVSIFRDKTFFGRLECISEQFNRNPQKFNEGITI